MKSRISDCRGVSSGVDAEDAGAICKPFRQHVTGNVYSTEENGKGPISIASIPDICIDGQRCTHWRKMPAPMGRSIRGRGETR